jgi:uncharacterized membrane protein HdeD (DUF308 family)
MTVLFERQVEYTDLPNLRKAIDGEISKHRKWYIFELLVFIAFAALAIVLPNITALALNVLIGALLVISGFAQILLYFQRRARWWRIFSGMLSLAAGGTMLVFPFMGIMALALLIAAFLLIEGFTEIAMALSFRPYFNWLWLFSAGLISIFLSGLIFFFFPEGGIIYLAVAVALNLFMYGSSLVALAWKSGKRPEAAYA